MVDALLAVERRTRAHLVTECERARMFLYMELTLCAIAPGGAAPPHLVPSPGHPLPLHDSSSHRHPANVHR